MILLIYSRAGIRQLVVKAAKYFGGMCWLVVHIFSEKKKKK